jgi:regulator of replication initiation timing
MDSLAKLEEKITKAVALIEKLNGEKKAMTEKNDRLETELSQLKSKLNEMEKLDSSRAEKVKEKLSNIIVNLNLLEQN